MDAREVGKIAAAVFDTKKYELRTHAIVKVTEYDNSENTVKLQIVRKAIRFTDAANIETVELPPLVKIIVRQFGSGKVWLTVAPQPDTYGYLHISDRDIDAWKIAGGIVEPTDTRCMELRDAVFEPSLLHLGDEGDAGKFGEPIKTDRISLRTRSGKTEISVLDDETIRISNEKALADLDVDGNITAIAEGDITATADGDVVIEAGGVATLTNGSGTIEIGNSGTVDINGNLTVDP